MTVLPVLSVTLERIYRAQCIDVRNIINPDGMLNGFLEEGPGPEALPMTDFGQAMPLSKSLNLLLHQMSIFQSQSHVDAVPRGFVQPGRLRGGEVEAVTPGHHAGGLISVGC